MYSTDASLYQILPLGVVIPRDAEDVEIAMCLAAEADVPVVPRGGGTSLAGQAIGQALMIDFAKYMNRVLSIDADRSAPSCVSATINTPFGIVSALRCVVVV